MPFQNGLGKSQPHAMSPHALRIVSPIKRLEDVRQFCFRNANTLVTNDNTVVGYRHRNKINNDFNDSKKGSNPTEGLGM